jgi:diguanylate cyclase (GGDEF)-like protein
VFLELLARFEKRRLSSRILIGFALIAAVGLLDYLTGYELAFSLFYVLPISLVTWSTNRQLGIIASLISALVWFGADLATGHPYSHPLLPVWNSLIRLSFFVIITLLLSSLRSLTERERALSRTDPLTGAANFRHFAELAQIEIDRLRRYGHPFSLAYIDLDNFKAMNDQFGHSTGDDILRTVATSASDRLREIDVVARLGGDEFALLLPQTDQQSAQVVVRKIRDMLVNEMKTRGWSITFSIGVLTYTSAPETIDDLVRVADELMYSVKHGGKDAIQFSTYSVRATVSRPAS